MFVEDGMQILKVCRVVVIKCKKILQEELNCYW